MPRKRTERPIQTFRKDQSIKPMQMQTHEENVQRNKVKEQKILLTFSCDQFCPRHEISLTFTPSFNLYIKDDCVKNLSN